MGTERLRRGGSSRRPSAVLRPDAPLRQQFGKLLRVLSQSDWRTVRPAISNPAPCRYPRLCRAITRHCSASPVMSVSCRNSSGVARPRLTN